MNKEDISLSISESLSTSSKETTPRSGLPNFKQIGNQVYYFKDRPLGKGSISEVYEGVYYLKDQYPLKAAVKIIKKKDSSTQVMKQLQKLMNQQDAVPKAKHENIAELIEVHETVDNFYLVSERCDSDLAKLLKEKTRFTELEAQKVFKQLVDVMTYNLRKNQARRDLTLANILINHELQVKLSDFGISRSYEENLTMETSLGTWSCMAPEIIYRKEYNDKVDLWSAGIILFQLVTGKLPFDAATTSEVEQIIINKQCEIPEGLVSKECEQMIYGLLQKNPEDRIDFKDLTQYPFAAFDTKSYQDLLNRCMIEQKQEQKQKQIQDLELQTQKLQQVNQFYMELEDKFDQHEQKDEDFGRFSVKLRRNTKQYIEQIDNLEKDKMEFKDKLDEKEQENQILLQQIEEHKCDKQEKEQLIINFAKDNNDLEENLNKKEHENKDLQKQIEEHQRHKQEKDEQIMNYQKDNMDLEDKLDQKGQKYQVLQQQIEEYQRHKQEKDEQIINFQKDNKKFKEKLDKKQHENNYLLQQIEEHQRHKREKDEQISNFQRDNQEFKEKLDQRQHENQELQQQIEEHHRHKREKDEQINNFQNDNKKFKDQLDKKEYENKDLQQQIEEHQRHKSQKDQQFFDFMNLIKIKVRPIITLKLQFQNTIESLIHCQFGFSPNQDKNISFMSSGQRNY